MQVDRRFEGPGESSPPTYRLHPVKAVTWATVFGSLLAGGIVLAINYERLEQHGNKARALVWSFLATLAIFFLAFLIPEDSSIPNMVFIVPQLVVMHTLARFLQGAAIESHVSRGGALASLWKGVGIGLACLAGIGVIFLAAVLVLVPHEFDPKVAVNANDEVFYTDGATKGDAILVGRLLTESEYFGDPEGASVAVSASDGGIYQVSFVLVDGAWDDPLTVEWVREVAERLSESRLGIPLKVELCDDTFRSRKSLVIDECNNPNLVVDTEASSVRYRDCWQVEYVVNESYPAENLRDRLYRSVAELDWQRVDKEPDEADIEFHSWDSWEGDSRGTVIEQWNGLFRREDGARLMVTLRYFGREGSEEPQPVLTSVRFASAERWESIPHAAEFHEGLHRIVNTVIEAFRNEDREAVAWLVSYPLRRGHPLPPIRDPQELQARFDEVFDRPLIDLIVNSDPAEDWESAGWQGVMFSGGTVWLDSNGRINAVNHESDAEKRIKERLIEERKTSLHESIREFESPVLEWRTASYRVRVDDLGEQNYRYAAWSPDKAPGDEPDLVLTGGELSHEGTGGNRSYTFRRGEYRYRCFVFALKTYSTPPGELEVFRGEESVLREPVEELL